MFFRFSDDATYGRFEWGADTDAVRDAYYDTAEQLADGHIDVWQAIDAYAQLAQDPQGAIHGNESLGGIYLQQGDLREARTHFDRAVAAGDRLVPKRYRGEIIWGEFDNRPYLRALHGAAEVRLRLRHGRAAAERIQRLLRFNPNDNTGARFLLGEALVRAGDFNRAREVLLEAPEHPSSWYMLGLVAILQDDAVAATTAFRRGAAVNLYAAQMITGVSPILPYDIGVFNGSYGGIDTAERFLDDCGDLFARHAPARDFLATLLRHPHVADEVENLYELRVLHTRVRGLETEAILRRRALSEEMEIVVEDMTDQTSRTLIRS